MSIYQEIILDHYHHPHNFGELEQSDADVAVTNSSCGDKIRMMLRVEKGKVVDVAFSGVGCAISLASASMLTDYVKGKKVTEVLKLNSDDLLKLLEIELTPSRLRCALLPLEGLSKAVRSL